MKFITISTLMLGSFGLQLNNSKTISNLITKDMKKGLLKQGCIMKENLNQSNRQLLTILRPKILL